MSRQYEYQYTMWVPADMEDAVVVLADTIGVRLNPIIGTRQGQAGVSMLVDMSNPTECQLALNLALAAVGMGASIGKAIIPALENGAKRTQEE